MKRSWLARFGSDSVIAAVITVAMAIAGAYIAASRAQARQELRLTNLESQSEKQEKEFRTADRDYAERVRQDMAEIKSDIKDMRNNQLQILERLGSRCTK